MAAFRSPWPAHWGRKQRSNATMADGTYAAISKKWFNEDIRCK